MKLSDNTLLPEFAAYLAKNIYSVNESHRRLYILLKESGLDVSSMSNHVLQASVGGHIFRSATDDFGVMAMGTGEYKNHMFLIFRGTTNRNNKADWVTDASVGVSSAKGLIPAHAGFVKTFKSMEKAIEKFKIGKQTSGYIHCIGHSLGGAIATLAAFWAYHNICKRVKLYTFGQPRVGLHVFSSFFTSKIGTNNIYRVFNEMDPVPVIPVFPYVHCPLPGKGYFLTSDHLMHKGAAHKMDKYIEILWNYKSWSSVPRDNVHGLSFGIEQYLNSRMHENAGNPRTFDYVMQGINWILSKFANMTAHMLQGFAMGVHTVIDKIAWALSKINNDDDGEGPRYVRLLVVKIQRILGLPNNFNQGNNTKAFFRYLLQILKQRAEQQAREAILYPV